VRKIFDVTKVEAGTLWVPSTTLGARGSNAVGDMSSAVRHSAPEQVQVQQRSTELTPKSCLLHYEAHRLKPWVAHFNNKYRLGASTLDQCAFARRICGRFTGSRRKANRTVKRRRTSYVRLLFTVRFLTSYLPIRRFHLGGKQRPQIFTGQDCLLLIQI